MKSNLEDVEVYKHHETEKAWLVSLDGNRPDAVWVPKSMAELAPTRKTQVWVLTAPQDVLEEKGLV